MTNLLAELPWIPLGTLLTQAGLLSREQVDFAVGIQKDEPGRRLGEIVVELGYASERQIAAALAEQYELEHIDLEARRPDPEALALLPEELARRYQVVPVARLDGGTVLIAVGDPTDLVAADDLRIVLGANVRVAVAAPSQLQIAIARAYRPTLELTPTPLSADGEERVEDIRDLASSAPTINLVNQLLTAALDEGASDLHFEPRRKDVVVRVRVDGVMRELATIPKHMQPAVTSRLKVMGSLDIAERRLPQDGRVSVHFGGDPIDLRIAVVPTTHGEHVVLRLATRQQGPPSLSELGMTPEVADVFRRAISQPYGAVIVCGPTGSGKTTTLYAALSILHNRDRVAMTIEDPVEYQLDGVNQVEVDVKAGLTFARGLRTILRSDPDVLLVGEIRDDETASVSIQAAMTGHLVLTSLHADTAAGAIARLTDMGVTPGLLANSLNCIVAQRLARKLCTHCRRPAKAAAREFEGLVAGGQKTVTVYEPGGCPKCDETGFNGRIALHEVMPVQGEIRGLVESSTDEIFSAAVRQGMVSLRLDGLRLCLEGVSSLAEIARITGDRLV
jgi:type IV pilus assembly protein PilB